MPKKLVGICLGLKRPVPEVTKGCGGLACDKSLVMSCNHWFVLLFRRSRSREKRSRSATPERKGPINAEGAITIKDEPLDKVVTL